MSLFSYYTKVLPVVLLFTTILFSCQKKEPSIPEQTGDLHQVSFSFSNFESEIIPYESPIMTRSTSDETKSAIHPERPEIMSYQDFNNKSNKPNFLFDNILEQTWRFVLDKKFNYIPNPNNPTDKSDFVLQAKGLEAIMLEISPEKVAEIDRLEFDFGASEKSPDGFYVEFQMDGVVDVSLNKIFHLKPQSIANKTMETFEIKFPKIKKSTRNFIVVIEFQNKHIEKPHFSSITEWELLFDNIRLYGTKKDALKTKNAQLPYFIFNKKDGNLIHTGKFTPSRANQELLLELPLGAYYSAMIYHENTDKLIIPASLKNKNEFYSTTLFKDKNARSFVSLDSFELKESLQKKVTLKRSYSLVTMDFTDLRDLSKIKKVVVRPLHPIYYWKPFNPKVVAETLSGVPNELVFEQDFNLHKEISFNQHLGLTNQDLPVIYEVEVWDDSRIVRKFRVNSSIKNNVKLIFKGSLYPSGIANILFEIIIDESWDATKVVDFK